MLSFILMFSYVSAFAAVDRTHRVDGGVNFSAAMPSDGNVDDAFYVGGNASYGVNEWLGIGISGGWTDPGFETSNGIEGPNVTMIPVFGDVILRAPTGENSWQPYGILGFGAIFANVHGTGILNDSNLHADNNSGFAFKLGGGLDWFTNDNWAFFGELSYVFTTANVEILRNTSNAEVDSIDLDTLYAGGGIKYLF